MTAIKTRIPAELLEIHRRGAGEPGFQFNVDALTARRIFKLSDIDQDMTGVDMSLVVRTKVIPCTAAEVLAFHSSRKEFIPAIPGHVIMVVAGYIIKPAGPAFTIGAGSFIQGRYNNTGFQAAVGFPVVGVLDLTTDTSGFTSPSAGPATTGRDAVAADISGKSIVSGTGGNVDYTGTGSPITLALLYRSIPTI